MQICSYTPRCKQSAESVAHFTVQTSIFVSSLKKGREKRKGLYRKRNVTTCNEKVHNGKNNISIKTEVKRLTMTLPSTLPPGVFSETTNV